MHHSCSVPKYSYKCPGIWRGHNRYVDEARCRGVSEVKGCEIEEVDDKQEFSRPEMAADPEHDKAESQKVILSNVRLINSKRNPKMYGH